jgi:ABC-type transport system involved in cytochrome bd biosynthesis fused ATPase/permease subunit
MPALYRDFAIAGAELLLVVAVFVVLRVLLGSVFRRLGQRASAEKRSALLKTILRNVTALLVLISARRSSRWWH